VKGLTTIYRRELASLFLAPLAWILLGVSLLLNGWAFVATLKSTGGDITYTLRIANGGSLFNWAVQIFLPPLLTMRMISEEARNGLLEFLQTSPVSDGAVVVGKFLAAWSFMAIFWLSGLAYALSLQLLGHPPDWPPVLGAYIGLLLVSGLFCSIGLFTSSITSAPVLAAFCALMGSVGILSLPWLVRLFEVPWLSDGVGAVDIMSSFDRSFLIGVLDTKVLVFFIAWTFFFTFLATRAVEAKRWR